MKYANRLSLREGLDPAYTINGFWRWLKVEANQGANGYRLPTEAEWEYAARGGGRSKGYVYSGSDDVDSVAWHSENSGGRTQPVGMMEDNELGLFDMSGNVWEWCWDWYGTYPNKAETNPVGEFFEEFRVVRGGSTEHLFGACRSTHRQQRIPERKQKDIGFRLVRPFK